MKKGFTLIELLIVVAIIAILAAIAVPNFLEAQTRAKVSRVKSDLRTFATALESYHIDHNKYPYNRAILDYQGSGYAVYFTEYLYELTTPVSFLSTVSIKDPFGQDAMSFNSPNNAVPPDWIGSYQYFSYKGWWGSVVSVNPKFSGMIMYPAGVVDGYMMSSLGPDKFRDSIEWVPVVKARDGAYLDMVYDPTNGTISKGDIGRSGGPVGVTLN